MQNQELEDAYKAIEILNTRLIERREAYEDYIAKQRIIGTLTVEWRGQRYWRRGCSRMGDVWITKDPTGATYYDHRVNVEELSNWKRFDDARGDIQHNAIGLARRALDSE